VPEPTSEDTGVMAYGRAGVALTIASIILISGIYAKIAWGTAQQPVIEQDYPYYRDLQTQTFGVDAGSSAIKTFEGAIGQKVSLTLNFDDGFRGTQQGAPSIVRTIINVTDSKGEPLVYDNNIGRTYAVQPIQIKNNGTVSISVTNQEDRPILVTMYLRQSAPTPAFDVFGNVAETFSTWLMIVSAPIFGLGVWLIVSERKKKDKDRRTEINQE
jgi:hypothetical protein